MILYMRKALSLAQLGEALKPNVAVDESAALFARAAGSAKEYCAMLAENEVLTNRVSLEWNKDLGD